MKEKLILSIQDAGKERGKRIYFTNKDLRKIKEKYGEDFFLFQEKKLLAQVDLSNDKITITPLTKIDTEKIGATRDTVLEFNQIHTYPPTVEEDKEVANYNYDLNEIDFEPSQLDFYIPMDGKGEKYWVSEVTVGEKIAFYSVATSISLEKKENKRKEKKYFPNLLTLENVKINYINDYLVYSPVPGFIADTAYTQIAKKKINGIEIPANISVPSDADLTPIVDMNKGKINGFEIKKRELLAKYEINAIISEKYKIEDINVAEINGEVVWEVLTDGEKRHFDLITGIEYDISLNPKKSAKLVKSVN
ncbi:MAG: hypothetical protein ACFFCM_12965 [Promethearchaeota archaeon]